MNCNCLITTIFVTFLIRCPTKADAAAVSISQMIFLATSMNIFSIVANIANNMWVLKLISNEFFLLICCVISYRLFHHQIVFIFRNNNNNNNNRLSANVQSSSNTVTNTNVNNGNQINVMVPPLNPWLISLRYTNKHTNYSLERI